MPSAEIIIGADFVPTESNFKLFFDADASKLIGDELLKILAKASYRIFNLEVPLTDKQTPILKHGPNLIAPAATINGYKAVGVDVLTLANNHIMDQGEQGLISTCKILRENSISYLGAGKTPEEALKPVILECGGKKIGVYACAEHEFSIVSKNLAGANPFDPYASAVHTAALKKDCDYVIILYHGGKEHYRYPSPDLQKRCRNLVESGADMVICQHSHCIGCREEYEHGIIIYGQGNFLFDNSESEYWQTSLLVAIGGNFEISYLPIVKCKNMVRLANSDTAKKILSEFEARSNEIKQEGFIENKYAQFAQSMLNNYLIRFSGINHNIFLRVLNKLSGYKFAEWFLNKKYKSEDIAAFRNFIECEAHRELIVSGLKSRSM